MRHLHGAGMTRQTNVQPCPTCGRRVRVRFWTMSRLAWSTHKDASGERCPASRLTYEPELTPCPEHRERLTFGCDGCLDRVDPWHQRMQARIAEYEANHEAAGRHL